MKLYQTIAMNTITTVMENQNKMVFYSKISSLFLHSQIRAPRIRILQELEVKFEGQTTSNSLEWLLCYLFNCSKYEFTFFSKPDIIYSENRSASSRRQSEFHFKCTDARCARKKTLESSAIETQTKQ